MSATPTPIFNETSSRIIKESIKSAIFIDEKALEPYAKRPEKLELEEELSINLYEKFKQQKISLAVHRFKSPDLINRELVDYFFEDRDLALIDWKLDGTSGEGYSLKLIEEVVKKPHLHFCCIYTTDDKIDNILDNLLSYFSSEDSAGYEELQLALEGHKAEIKPWLGELKRLSYNRKNREVRRQIVAGLMKSKGCREVIEIAKETLKDSDTVCGLIKVGVAFDESNPHKSEVKNTCPSIIDPKNGVLVIDNTVVLIIRKDKAGDPDHLIERITKQVLSAKDNFSQLLGLEMKNVFKKKGAFVDKNLLSVPKEAFLKHRQQLQAEGLKTPFNVFVKDVLIEQARMNLISSDLKLLDDKLLDELQNLGGEVDTADLLSMNVFYNATRIADDTKVNFGDVFKCDATGEYFLCITPKSDCLRPKEKIKNTFFFAKGAAMSNKDLALKLADTAFISFLDEKTVVQWAEPGKEAGLSTHQPLYVKPVSYTIPDPNYSVGNTVEMLRLDEDGKPQPIESIYITTLRRSYAQRIANHAFAHPARVSVDFVKIKAP